MSESCNLTKKRTAPRSSSTSIRSAKSKVFSEYTVSPIEQQAKPKLRSECPPHPCPWASCKYNLFLDVKPNGSVTVNFPHLEFDELTETCCLNLCDEGHTLDKIGNILNLSRERVRQIEEVALNKIKSITDRVWLDK